MSDKKLRPSRSPSSLPSSPRHLSCSMSGYVPPHLRNAAGGASPSGGARGSGGAGDSPSAYGAPRTSTGGGAYDRGSSFGRRSESTENLGAGVGGGSVGGARRVGSSGDLPSSSGYGPPGSGSRTSGSGFPEAVFATWTPPASLSSLTEEQVESVRQRLNVMVEAAPGQAVPPGPVESFDDMALNKNILLDIRYHGYDRPTPIQCQAMPIALCGHDILGCAETGSGKTAAFSIPLIHHCLAQVPIRRGDGPLAMVLAPTRELAQQIAVEIKAFSRSSRGFKVATIVGGASMSEQRGDLRSGVEVIVATPGRLIDHLQSHATELDRVSWCVLDEADRMLDMGFEPQIKDIMRQLPSKHQTLLFSATMPTEVETLAAEYLNHPVKVRVGQVSTPTANVSQHLEKVVEAAKLDRLCQLLLEEQAEANTLGRPLPMTVVFVERKTKCDEVADLLTGEGIPAVALHGGRSQGEREHALASFAAGKVPVLVATDVASRGLDVKGIAHVVNMDLPKALEDYVHRIGRTGRAGSTGRATSFYTERDAFLVTHIKTALAEMERGNVHAFATGKEARRKEREDAAAWRTTGGSSGDGDTVAAGGAVRLDEKYKFMSLTQKAPAAAGSAAAASKGTADDAWDD